MNGKDLIKKSEEYQALKRELENARKDYEAFNESTEKEIALRFAALSNTIRNFCGSDSFRLVIKNLCYLYPGILSVSAGNLTYRGAVLAPMQVNGSLAYSLAQRCLNDIRTSFGILAKKGAGADGEIRKLCVSFTTLRNINARISELKEQAIREALSEEKRRMRETEQKVADFLWEYPEFEDADHIQKRIAEARKYVQRQNDRFRFRNMLTPRDYGAEICLPFAAKTAEDEWDTEIFSWNPVKDGILYVRIPSGRYEVASDFIIALAIQFLYSYPLMDKQILYCCQSSLSQMDHFLNILREECRESVFFNGIEQIEADHFYLAVGECLKDLRNEVKRRSVLMDEVSAENIYAYNATEGADIISPVLVFLHDYPEGFSGYKDLGFFFRECARYGVFFVVLQTGFGEKHMDRELCDPSKYRGIGCELSEDGGITVNGMLCESVDMDREMIRPLLRQLSENAEKGRKHSYLSYEDIGFGQMNCSADGYCTKISIPVGTVDNKPVSLHFATSVSGEDRKNGVKTPIAYLIVGNPNSGKSTLIDALIVNGSMAYSPDDLIFYLLDFKDGVTASFYDAEKAIPHVRMIASHNKEEDSDIILSGLLMEKERRNELFKHCDTADIAGYNSKSGKKMPRIIVVVDECQNLFASDLLAKKCEKLVREGRSAGIHLVLASQSVSRNMMQHAGNFIDGRFCFFMNNKNDAEQVISSSYTKSLHVDIPSGSGRAYMSLESGENCRKIQVAFHGGDENGQKLEYNKKIREKWAKQGYGIRLVKAGEDSPLPLDAFSAEENPLLSEHSGVANIGENYFDHSAFGINFTNHDSHAVFLAGAEEKPFTDILTSLTAKALASGGQIRLIDESMDRALSKLFGSHPRVTCYGKERYMDVLGEVCGEFERRKQDFRTKHVPYFFIIHSLYRIQEYMEDKPSEYEVRTAGDMINFSGDMRAFYNRIQSGMSEKKDIFGKKTLLSMLAEAGNADNFHIIITTNSLPDLYYDRAAVKNCGYKILQHNVQDADGIMEASFRKEMMRNLNENLVFVSEKGIYSKCRYFQYDMEKENTKKLLSAAVKGNG